MRIWIWDTDVDNYEILTWGEGIDLDDIQSFNGSPKNKGWEPMQVNRVYGREFSNSPGLSPHIPVLDKTSAMILGDIIAKDAELLPLRCSDGEFYAVNTTRVLNCIDLETSKYKMFRDNTRIMRFTEYGFDREKIGAANIFRISELPLSRPFVSDAFRNKVMEHKLTGFVFELAWEDNDL